MSIAVFMALSAVVEPDEAARELMSGVVAQIESGENTGVSAPSPSGAKARILGSRRRG